MRSSSRRSAGLERRMLEPPDMTGAGEIVRRPGAHLRTDLDDRRRARLARRARERRHARSHPRCSARAREGDRHRRRSGPARDLQQSVHGHRRGDGRRAPVDRDQRQHQGAARFLLRDLRCRRRADRQCAAHSGASRLDGREHPADHRHARRRAGRARHPPRRCLCAERSLSRRHAPAGHHRDRAGLLRRRSRAVGLRRGARAPCRHRRDRAGIDAARQPHASIRKAC